MGSDISPASQQGVTRRSLRELLRRELSSKSWNKSGRTINTLSSHSSHEDKSSRKCQCSVVFADTVDNEEGDSKLCLVEFDDSHVEPLSEEERSQYFYTASDVQSFQKDSALTAVMYIKRREANIPWEEEDYTIRGLEEMIQNASMKPGEPSGRAQHCAKVLAEQAKLKNQNMCSAEKLRGISCNSSKGDRASAIIKAKYDAAFCGHKPVRRTKIVRQLSAMLSPASPSSS